MSFPFHHRMEHLAPGAAPALNLRYECMTLDRKRLGEVLDQDSGVHGFFAGLQHSHPTLFSETMVFLSADVAAQIQSAISAIESVVDLPGWRRVALADATSSAQVATRGVGVLMGYDFHVDASGPKLIEINTNAGGAFLNAELARAQQACCARMGAHFRQDPGVEQIDERLWNMFEREWQLERPDQLLTTVAVVDDAPQTQFLWPEFLLAQQMFERHGVRALIADANELIWDGARLRAGDVAIDLVYNRLTDFALADHPALREAYAAGAIVLTPTPAQHAFYAHKVNLVRLADEAFLREIGADEQVRALLQAVVPEAHAVYADDAGRWWSERGQWFFKPNSGFGSRAVYRGDKLTRRVFAEILRGGYIAQRRVAPAERCVDVDGTPTNLKFDLRAYTYAGEVLMLTARMYDGQTTNLRTRGGGFAPVAIVASQHHSS